MPVKGVSDIRRKIGSLKVKIDKNTERTLTAIVTTARGHVMLKTPVDTATLINSLQFQVFPNGAILFFKNGFADVTGFNYALKLETTENWKPSKKPNAGPHFLRDGFESPEARADIKAVIEANNRL